MNLQKQKCPAFVESGISETFHLDPVNRPYFNMITTNHECILFCCEVLRNYDELLNKYWVGDPIIERSDRLRLYLALVQKEEGGSCNDI